jgi:hypothetical protein
MWHKYHNVLTLGDKTILKWSCGWYDKGDNSYLHGRSSSSSSGLSCGCSRSKSTVPIFSSIPKKII